MFHTYEPQTIVEQRMKAAQDLARTYQLIRMAQMPERANSIRLLTTISSFTRSAMHKLGVLKPSQTTTQAEYRSAC